jgi:hypothetical protein
MNMNTTRTYDEVATSATRTSEVRVFEESMRVHLLAAMDGSTLFDREIAALFNRKKLRTRLGERWSTSAVGPLRVRLGIRKR